MVTPAMEAKSFIRLPSEAIIVTEGQSINVTCRTIPVNAITKWSFSGADKSTNADLFSVKGRYNHTLSIIRSMLENEGRFTCQVVDTDVNASFDLIVKPVACPSDISHGLVWEGQSESTTAFKRCSNLHQNFRSRVYASRRCNAKGEWEHVDLTNCTMHLNSYPIIAAQATLTPANACVVTNFNSSVYSVLAASRYRVKDMHIETLFHREEESVTVAVIATVDRDDIAVNDLKLSIIKWLRAVRDDPQDNTTNSIDTISDVEVTGYLPSFHCRCNVTAEPDSVNTVCMGANVPPCIMMDDRYQCNNPLFVGNGDVCGLDSDGDGFPDAELKCDDQYCRMDLCPDVYSTNSFGAQDPTVCSQINQKFGTGLNITVEPFDGCQARVDETWQLYWPQTPVNSVIIRRCGGIDSIGLVRRRCMQNNTWGPVEDFQNCYSTEISSLFDSSRKLRSFYYGDNVFDYFDIREFPLLDVNTASSELYSLTNSSRPLAPRDLISINGILDTIISINEESDISGDGNINTIAGDLFATFSNLLNDSNSISYQVDDYGYDYGSDYDYYYYEEGYSTAESLLRNIDNFASVFKSLLVSYAQQSIKYNDKNFNISFELPSEDKLQSSGGMEFNTGQSQIYIPYTAIQHQKNTEGVQVPIVNYAARNLASVLPARALNNITEVGNQVISSQISSGPISLPPDGYIRLTFILDKPLNGDPKCVFWNYTLEIDNATGGWSDRDVFMDVENSNSTTITCITKHLTSFAVLVDHSGTITDNDRKSTVQSTALSIVSYIGCGVSIICLVATVCAILMFRKSVFKDRQHMIHLNLATALLLGLIVFVSGVETASGNRLACIAVTLLLHYFFLATFCWMLCEGIIIYLLLVRVFYNGFFKSMLFYAAIGWGLPIPVVAITLGISHDDYGDSDICWLPEDKGIMWAFIGPVILIIMCNSIILLIAIYSIYKASRHKKDHQGMTNVKMAKNLAKATVILLPILGCTWIIGIIAVNENLIVFAWIFTILNSLQGVCIFILYVLRSEELKKRIRSFLGMEATESKGTSYSSTIRMTLRNFSRSTLFSGIQKKNESQISQINIKCDTELEKTSDCSNSESDSLGTNEQPN